MSSDCGRSTSLRSSKAASQDWLRLADAKQIELHFDIAPTPIMGDEFLLRELMDNLVANAIQYTPGGGHVGIGCSLRGSGALVYVEDTGPGIAPAERPKVFKRFYRVPGSSA